MRYRWLIAIVSGILLTGLGIGWAASAFEIPDEDYIEKMRLYQSMANAHIEGNYADCTLGFEQSDARSADTSSSIDLSCGINLGSGGGLGGTNGDVNPSLLSPNFRGDSNHIQWERDKIEFCSLETASHTRSADIGPNTLLITINCWWFDDQKETIVLNSTISDLALISLADEASYAILGVVTQINPIPYNLTEYNQTVFTDVTIAVNENLKGTYDDPLITIRFEGGETQDLIVINEDAPRFEVGESVFVLLKESDNTYALAGLYLGKYTIGNDGFATNRDYDRNISLEELRAIFEEYK